MANELTIGLSASLTKSEFTHSIPFFTDTVTITAAPATVLEKVVNAPTADTALVTTGIGTLGYAYIKNLGPTNYVDIGPDSGGSIVPAIRLKAGEQCLLRLVPGVTYRHQANTAAVDLHVVIYDN